VEIIAPHLPAAWAARLRGLARRPFTEWSKGRYGELLVLSKDDLSAEIAAALSFADLDEEFIDEEFIQDKNLLKRARPT
jgi:hypothetical protein